MLHNLCFSFLLGITAVSREIENNAYAKFWGQIRCIMGNVEVAYVVTTVTGIHWEMSVIRQTILFVSVWIQEILTQTWANVPQGVLLLRVRDAATQNKFLSVKNAKVVTTCILIKLSYQFGNVQLFIKWNAQQAHTTIHISLNLLLPSQLFPYE